jgi:hypothetical protein
MEHTIHNMRMEELPQSAEPAGEVPDVPVRAATMLRVVSLTLMVLVWAGALAAITGTGGGGLIAVLPVILLIAAGVTLHRANELDPSDY